VVDFAGGYLSSDGGGLFLRELEVRSGLLRELSECFIDRRDQRFVEHSVQSLINQRVNGLVLGYEDLNDHDELRRDPLHGLIAGKSDPLGQDRTLERDKGKALAAHSTLYRLELGAEFEASRGNPKISFNRVDQSPTFLRSVEFQTHKPILPVSIATLRRRSLSNSV